VVGVLRPQRLRTWSCWWWVGLLPPARFMHEDVFYHAVVAGHAPGSGLCFFGLPIAAWITDDESSRLRDRACVLTYRGQTWLDDGRKRWEAGQGCAEGGWLLRPPPSI